MDELISVIVPVYNVAKYLREAIDSIINQTYKNLEIILVDDGSTDESPMICDEYEKKDSRIKVIHQKNTGLSGARNNACLIANGKYIGFVDSDDTIRCDMYEILYKTLIKEDADMVICNHINTNENGEIISNDLPIKDEVLTSYEAQEKLGMGMGADYVIACNKLYRKELLSKVQFPVGKVNEDLASAHLFFAECKKIVTLKEGLYYYRIREGSIMTSKVSIKRLDGVEAVYNRFLWYQEHKMDALLSGTYTVGRQNYELIAKVSADGEKDRLRIREIKSMFRYMYKNTKGNKDIKDFVILIMPNVYFKLAHWYRAKVRKK